jgi:hypothetical protein
VLGFALRWHTAAPSIFLLATGCAAGNGGRPAWFCFSRGSSVCGVQPAHHSSSSATFLHLIANTASERIGSRGTLSHSTGGHSGECGSRRPRASRVHRQLGRRVASATGRGWGSRVHPPGGNEFVLHHLMIGRKLLLTVPLWYVSSLDGCDVLLLGLSTCGWAISPLSYNYCYFSPSWAAAKT